MKMDYYHQIYCRIRVYCHFGLEIPKEDTSAILLSITSNKVK